MNGRPWTDAELGMLWDLSSRGIPYKDMVVILQNAFGHRKYTIDNIGKKLQILRSEVDARSETRMAEIIKGSDLTLKELLEAAKDRAAMLARSHAIQKEVVRTYKPKSGWQLIVFSGDWHVGSGKCDYDELLNLVESIRDTEDCSLMFMGDAYDGMVAMLAPPAGAYESVLPPHLERKMAEKIFDELKGKLVALIGGCHNKWLQKIDHDVIAAVASRIGTPYMGNGGVVTIVSGHIPYRFGVFHKGKSRSTINPFQPCISYLQRQNHTVDGCFFAHDHVNAAGFVDIAGRACVVGRTAAFKHLDGYADGIGFTEEEGSGIAKTPCVLLCATERKMLLAQSLTEGISLLNSMKG